MISAALCLIYTCMACCSSDGGATEIQGGGKKEGGRNGRGNVDTLMGKEGGRGERGRNT